MTNESLWTDKCEFFLNGQQSPPVGDLFFYLLFFNLRAVKCLLWINQTSVCSKLPLFRCNNWSFLPNTWRETLVAFKTCHPDFASLIRQPVEPVCIEISFLFVFSLQMTCLSVAQLISCHALFIWAFFCPDKVEMKSNRRLFSHTHSIFQSVHVGYSRWDEEFLVGDFLGWWELIPSAERYSFGWLLKGTVVGTFQILTSVMLNTCVLLLVQGILMWRFHRHRHHHHVFLDLFRPPIDSSPSSYPLIRDKSALSRVPGFLLAFKACKHVSLAA